MFLCVECIRKYVGNIEEASKKYRERIEEASRTHRKNIEEVFRKFVPFFALAAR